MTGAYERAQAALYEAARVGKSKTWDRYWLALISDRQRYPGGPLRVITLRESLLLTCGLFAHLQTADLLLVGRYLLRVQDRTPWDWSQDYDELSPVTRVGMEVVLPAEASSLFAVGTAQLEICSHRDEPTHVIIGALERPMGWPL